MTSEITSSKKIQTLLDNIAGLDKKEGDPRTKEITRRIVGDLFAAIEDLDITEEELWKTVGFFQEAAPEMSLIMPGLGFDHFCDVLMDAADEKAGKGGGTPRTIEGPLYVENAPVCEGCAEDMVNDGDGHPMDLSGVVKDTSGKPIPGARVDVWHASKDGGYSHFDPSLKEFAFRRTIIADENGAYRAKSIVPSGYAVPPGGFTEQLLDKLGRHGNRPAHVHFFASAPGHSHLTTQINIAGDPFTYDDFAFATRDELVAQAKDVDGVANIEFDLVLAPATDEEDTNRSGRPRVVG
ncbi:catechol 1,2-dioxygenase [Arenicella sp.]|nr:catechol 1,2-dioxygenase [Arenicella sp.]